MKLVTKKNEDLLDMRNIVGYRVHIVGSLRPLYDAMVGSTCILSTLVSSLNAEHKVLTGY